MIDAPLMRSMLDAVLGRHRDILPLPRASTLLPERLELGLVSPALRVYRGAELI